MSARVDAEGDPTEGDKLLGQPRPHHTVAGEGTRIVPKSVNDNPLNITRLELGSFSDHPLAGRTSGGQGMTQIAYSFTDKPDQYAASAPVGDEPARGCGFVVRITGSLVVL